MADGISVNEFRRDRAWRVVVAAALGSGLSLTVLPFYTLGVFVRPLSEAFGWSRTQVQASIGCITLGTVLAGWFVGWLSDRYGVRVVALMSQAGFALGLILLTLAQGDILVWYGLWLAMALLGMGTTPITWTRGVAGWFEKQRGLALALTLMGSGVVGAVAPPLLAGLIERAGWRAGYFAIAMAVLLFALPFTVLFFREPVRLDNAVITDPAVATGATLAEALRGYRFWLLAVTTVAVAFGMGGVIPNLAPLLADKGFTAGQAASLVAIVGITVMIGRVAAGHLLDRLWAPAVSTSFLALPSVAFLILSGSASNPALTGTAVGLIGLATGAEFAVLAYLCARSFGIRYYSQIYAMLWMAFTLAAGLAPGVFARVYDVTGSYDPILQTSAVLFAVAPPLLLFLGSAYVPDTHASCGQAVAVSLQKQGGDAMQCARTLQPNDPP